MALDILHRAAPLTPASFNAEAMTVEAVISTFSDVQRRDSRGDYIERLSATGLDLSNLTGAPVLDGHRQGSARDVIGTVTGHRMEGGKLIATIQLSAAPDVASIVTRIREGTLRGVSVGYRVTKWAESIDPATKTRIRTAAAWSIQEVSGVPIPADAGATFRKADTMELDDDTIQTRAEIRTIARSAALSVEWADAQIDSGATVIEARAAAFEELQTRKAPKIKVGPSHDDPSAMMTRRADALYARVSGTAPSEEAKPFMVETLRDMARAAVEASGNSTRGMDADQLFRAAMHTTSDFPNLLNSTGNRTLMAAYQVAQSPLKQIARQATLADFRPASKLKLSDVGALQELTESGEIKSTTRGEAVESYSLRTYATQFSISRKALINDDLGAFRDWGATAGRMAAETEANVLVALLLSNPTMGEDSQALFHAAHGNLGTAGALNVANLGLARKAMRGMKGLDKVTPINATPRYLVVGPDQETTAEQVLASIYAATVADVNPFATKLTPLVDPRIAGNRWYLFADPASLPCFEYAYLSSAQGPQMASFEGWDVLGMEYRVVLDFGAGATDWRGAYLNPGQ
ncbi:MAG: Mu-like prophage major head subunit gpT family protein [Rhodobacter sp.]|nr:Mu-like prophage major head subunit gpT family protein [Rhodobacter sp.]